MQICLNELTTHKPGFLEGLNGIRALSAFLVILTHWPSNFLSLKFGWMGVNFFFVLSGFLITRILLVEKKEKNLKTYLGNFYYKRLLRIFPLYYMFLLVMSVIILLGVFCIPSLIQNEIWKGGYNAVKYDMPFYATYTYNLRVNLRLLLQLPDSANYFFAHLWSLSVEEQFYLVFPFVVYFASLKNLKRVIIALLIICPLIRLWASLYGNHIVDKYWLGEVIYSNTICQADALAAGAALAVFRINLKRPYLWFWVVSAIWLIVGLIHLYLLRKSGYFLIEGKSLGYNFPGYWYSQPTPYFLVNIRAFYLYPLVNLLAVTIILPAALKKPLFPKLFTAKPIDYLGKISYGIYVYHNALIGIFFMILGRFGGLKMLGLHPGLEVACFVIYLAILILISHLSYRYFESRFLALKQRKFPH